MEQSRTYARRYRRYVEWSSGHAERLGSLIWMKRPLGWTLDFSNGRQLGIQLTKCLIEVGGGRILLWYLRGHVTYAADFVVAVYYVNVIL